MKKTKSFKYYYLSFKESPYFLHTVYGGIAVLACIIGIFFIFPLITRLIDINQQVADTQKKVTMLQKNINYIKSLDDYKISNDADIAKAAVPLEKDYAGTIQAIMASAVRANINLSDFTIQVGPLKKAANNGTNTPNFNLQISVSGDLPSITAFVGELRQKVPLLDVSALSYQKELTQVTVVAEVAPYTAKTLDLSQNEISISSDNERLLNKLSNWKTNSVIFTPPSSGSGSLPPF